MTPVRNRASETRLSRVARDVRKQRLTYLSPARLRNLERCTTWIEERGVVGDVLEAGVALGGSAILLAARCRTRAFHGYDVFGMIPPPGDRDPEEVHRRYATIVSGRSEGIGGDRYYGYRDDLYDEVSATFDRFGMPVGERIKLHRGRFEEALHPRDPVALAHIDCDWYGAVKTCLDRLEPVMSPGAFMVLDDYHDYGGCHEAVEEFLGAHPEWRVVLDNGNLAISRDPP